MRRSRCKGQTFDHCYILPSEAQKHTNTLHFGKGRANTETGSMHSHLGAYEYRRPQCQALVHWIPIMVVRLSFSLP